MEALEQLLQEANNLLFTTGNYESNCAIAEVIITIEKQIENLKQNEAPV